MGGFLFPVQVSLTRTYEATIILPAISIITGISILFALLPALHTPIISSFSHAHRKNNLRSQKLVHVIVGQRKRKGLSLKYSCTTPFSFFNYLVLLVARLHIQPTTLFVHSDTEPNTCWWKVSKQDPDIRMTVVKSHRAQKIFSKPVKYRFHRFDVLRLEVLLKYGGIYLDSDVPVLRSFDPLLNLNNVQRCTGQQIFDPCGPPPRGPGSPEPARTRIKIFKTIAARP